VASPSLHCLTSIRSAFHPHTLPAPCMHPAKNHCWKPPLCLKPRCWQSGLAVVPAAHHPSAPTNLLCALCLQMPHIQCQASVHMVHLTRDGWLACTSRHLGTSQSTSYEIPQNCRSSKQHKGVATSGLATNCRTVPHTVGDCPSKSCNGRGGELTFTSFIQPKMRGMMIVAVMKATMATTRTFSRLKP
jgi:hypothetical protein